MSTLSSLGITRADTEAKIQSLVHALVHIQDENGAFLLHLEGDSFALTSPRRTSDTKYFV